MIPPQSAVVGYDTNGVIVAWSPSAESIFGHSSAEIMGRNVARIVPDDLLEEHRDALRRLADGQTVTPLETERLHKDGRRIAVKIALSAIVDPSGAAVAVCEGICEQIPPDECEGPGDVVPATSDDRSGESEELSRALVAAPARIVWVTNGEGRVIGDTSSWRAFTGQTEEEMSHTGWMEVVHPEDRLRIGVAWKQAVAGGEPYSSEYRIRRADGEWRLIVARGAPVRDISGEVQSWVGLITDITDRRRAERALLETRQRFERIVRATTDAVWDWDFESGEVWWNEGISTLFGYAEKDVDSDEAWWLGQIHPDDREAVAAEVHRAIDGTDPIWSGEYRFLRADGSYANVFDRGRVQRDESGRAVRMTGGMADITERKQAEEALRQSEERLRQSQKLEAVGRLAGGVAHDFNNLLTIISGYSDFIKLGLRPEDPLRRCADEIAGAAERAAVLTRQLLAFSRKQLLQPVVLDLNRVVGDMSTMLGRLIGEDVEFETRLTSNNTFVLTDPGQLEQVLVNLVVNARDAMPSGGTLAVETSVVTVGESYAREHPGLPSGEFVMLAVRDTGVGMDAETREHIFEPFFTTKEQGKGTGLGLATVYGIVAQSGGSICVHSEPGRGSTFEIYLPATDAEHETPSGSAPITGDARDGETVLLVEDEQAVRAIAIATLKHHGYHVLEAQSPDEALTICESFEAEIDILVTDVVMPKMNGRDLATRVERMRPGIRVLFMSGYSEDVIAHQGVLDEDLAFLQKPFSPEGLARKVREVIDGA